MYMYLQTKQAKPVATEKNLFLLEISLAIKRMGLSKSFQAIKVFENKIRFTEYHYILHYYTCIKLFAMTFTV